MNYISLNDVKVDNRVRECKEQDVISLAESIKTEGLIHPITISEDNTLIAGGHRLAAFKLLAQTDSRYNEIPFIRYEEYARDKGLLEDGKAVSKAQLKLLEIEENVKRKSMTWQEQALGIATYHELAKNIKGAGIWTHAQTAALFGVGQTWVSALLRVAKRLKNKNDSIWQCESITDAVQTLLKEKRQEVQKKLAESMKFKQKKATPTKQVKVEEKKEPLTSGINFVDNSDEAELFPRTELVSKDTIDLFYNKGDSLKKLFDFKGEFDHIITDPPYGISMDNFMNAESVERVKETHQVDSNLVLIKQFIDVARQCAKDTSFLCMWYDLDHHEKIQEWAKKYGWTSCRWNFVWCKTSPCINRTAQYNITKATEVCCIMRASSKAVLAQKRSTNWILADSVGTSPEHPFGKPNSVWRWLIDTVSFEGQTIIDPFAGCGSALASIFKAGRLPIGIDLDEKHILNGKNWLYKELNK